MDDVCAARHNDPGEVELPGPVRLVDLLYKPCKPEKNSGDMGQAAVGLTVMGWIAEFLDMFKNPFSFKGRIRRLEYNLSIPIVIVVATLGFALGDSRQAITVIPGALMVVAAVWFELAQKAKRFHDLGHPTWYLINFFAYSKLTGEPGQAGENQYGPDPKPAKV